VGACKEDEVTPVDHVVKCRRKEERETHPRDRYRGGEATASHSPTQQIRYPWLAERGRRFGWEQLERKNVGGIDTTMVSPHVRITEFPNESFYSDENNLSRAGRCQIMKKMSNWRAHSTYASHVSALQKLTSSKINESEVTSLLYKRKPEFVGTAVKEKQLVI
jgi:hypothetical protein